MGALLYWGAIVLGLILGLVIFSLLSLAQKGERFYDHMGPDKEASKPPSQPVEEIFQQQLDAEGEALRGISDKPLVQVEPKIGAVRVLSFMKPSGASSPVPFASQLNKLR